MTKRVGKKDGYWKGRAAFDNDDFNLRADLEKLFAERDRMYAMDDRTPAEQWLGDPPHWRSALGG